MATGSYMTPTYSRSQSEVQGDLHNLEDRIYAASRPSRNVRELQDHRELKRPPVGVVWWLGEGVPDQESSSSLDHGSKLRGPSPKALV
ncbi:hypothetical protein TNCV_2112451 [Trichonephila clavipes]|nr:hypothetical protein TNCV_2112451 [Trichonephila clavipes]